MPQSPHLQTVFDSAGDVYRKMVENDYLNHRDVYACLRERLVDATPFRFLDVACWTAECSADALAGTPITAYYGIDLVDAALAEAERILRRRLECPVHLVAGDYVPTLAAWSEPVDIVWIGLSLHHQDTSGKLEVMRDIRRILAAGGCLLIYENTSRDGEDRDGWLARWDGQRDDWTAYSPAEWQAMRDHVATFDHPETLSSWRDLAAAAGFAPPEELYCCPTDLFRMFAFRAAS
jgi:SAM-dependent methyltransferase